MLTQAMFVSTKLEKLLKVITQVIVKIQFCKIYDKIALISKKKSVFIAKKIAGFLRNYAEVKNHKLQKKIKNTHTHTKHKPLR